MANPVSINLTSISLLITVLRSISSALHAIEDEDIS